MTEAQRDYLADLALRKGVTVDASVARSPSWASKEIERLKALPDPSLGEFNDQTKVKLNKLIRQINAEIDKWHLA